MYEFNIGVLRAYFGEDGVRQPGISDYDCSVLIINTFARELIVFAAMMISRSCHVCLPAKRMPGVVLEGGQLSFKKIIGSDRRPIRIGKSIAVSDVK